MAPDPGNSLQQNDSCTGQPNQPCNYPDSPTSSGNFHHWLWLQCGWSPTKKTSWPGPGSKSFGLAGLLKPAPKPKAKASADGSKASCGQKGLGNDKSSSDSVSGSDGAPSSRSFFSMLTNLNLVNMTWFACVTVLFLVVSCELYLENQNGIRLKIVNFIFSPVPTQFLSTFNLFRTS